MESDIRWGLEDPESGGEAQTLGERDVYYYMCWRLREKGSEERERKVGFIEITAMRHRRGG